MPARPGYFGIGVPFNCAYGPRDLPSPVAVALVEDEPSLSADKDRIFMSNRSFVYELSYRSPSNPVEEVALQ
jgi:hypothetical protein